MSEFYFMDCVEIKELLGKRADDERELMDLLEEVPVDSIYFHTHSYFLRHFYIAGPYTNDFANWVAIQVRDKVLGEKLAEITPSGTNTLEDVRVGLIEVIDDHLSSLKSIPAVVYGQPFHFMLSRIIEIPIGISVKNLDEFYRGLKSVDASAIYNHIYEARLRDKRGRSDFSIWLDEGLGLKDLAERIEKVDSYMYSLEGLRNKLLALCKAELGK